METMRNSYLILDIETFKNLKDKKFIDYKIGKIDAPSNYKDPAKIQAYIEEKQSEQMSKLALSPLTGQVIAVGFKTLGNEYEILIYAEGVQPQEIADLQSLYPNWFFFDSEKLLLQSAFQTINDAMLNGSTLVTFNGKSFDMPFLFTRGVINNLTEPLKDYPELIHNYRHDKHIDLTSFFDKGSLNSLSYLMGVGDLYDEKGNAIEKYYEKKDYNSIKEKLTKDLDKTEAIYEKIKTWIPQRASYY